MTSMHRRRLLGAAAALPFAQAGMAQELPLTPACGPQSALTPRQTEGPYYTPHTPQRGSLVEPGSRAERLILAGRVVSPSCQPVAKALLDFWHCDENGSYDNVGFRYRGHLFSDAEGRFRLETIWPAIYPGSCIDRLDHPGPGPKSRGCPALMAESAFDCRPAGDCGGL